MLLDYARLIHFYEVGYSMPLIRGMLLIALEAALFYIAYNDENPTSFVYLAFGGIIFASKMRLRPTKVFDPAKITPEEKLELEHQVRDNQELFKVKFTGRIFYFIFALAMTVIFIGSIVNGDTLSDNDVYPFIQIKPEEMKTKYLLLVLGMSWGVLILDIMCGRSYQWSELMVYDKFNVKIIQIIIDYVLIFLIFSFSQQVRFSIFSLIFFFFVLITITVFLFSLLRGNQKTISFDRYISFLKWLTLAGAIIIYSKKSYRKFIDLFGRYGISGKAGSTIMREDYIKDLIDQFIDKEENLDRVLWIFFLSSLRLYFADITKMIDNIREILDEKLKIEDTSHMVSYFSNNILGIMNMRGSEVKNYNGTYKVQYLYELEEVQSIKDNFSKIFCKVKVKVTTLQKYTLIVEKIVRAFLAIFIRVFKNHTTFIFQLILNYLIITNTQYMMLMILPLIWCMLSFVAFTPVFSTTISLVFLYIPTGLAILQVVASNILCKKNGVINKLLALDGYCTFMSRYPILSENNPNGSLEDEKNRLFGLLTLAIFYVILLIEKRKNFEIQSFSLVKKFENLGQEIKNTLYEDVTVLIKFILSKIFSNFFYICLIFLFVGIIQTISVFNIIFIGFFFYFILNSQKAKQYWIFLLLYLQFLLIIRFLYSLKIFTFNLDRETNAMIGLYFGTGNPKDENSAYIRYWLVLIAISTQYQLFYTKLALEFRRVELKFHSQFLETCKRYGTEIKDGLHTLYLNLILWFFHFFLTLILIYSERTVFNVALMMMELGFFFYHLKLSRTFMDLDARRRLNKFWMVLVVTILIFAFLFYIFLFCKYTVTKRYLSKILDLSDSPSKSWILNSQIQEEFTMIYLVKQKRLQIEENSFILENLKILLGFVSFFKIFVERKAIKAEEEKLNGTSSKTSGVEMQESFIPNDNEIELDLDGEPMNGEGEHTEILKKSQTEKEEPKLLLSFKDLKYFFDRVLIYLSHLWKSSILFHITYWNLQGPNLFKVIILFAILITFYRYLKSATDLMSKSKLTEVLDKKLKYYFDSFVRRFEIETSYPGLNMDQGSDHYMVANKKYYESLRNQFSLINIKISKLLYFLVFHLSWLYFVYVYILHMVREDNNVATASLWFQLFSPAVDGMQSNQIDYKKEEFITFILITLLLIENKIIETVGENLENLEQANPEKVDTERSSANLLAHLDLYIAKRTWTETQILKQKNKDKKAQADISASDLNSSKILEQSMLLKPEQTAPVPSPSDHKTELSEEVISQKIEVLMKTINDSSANPEYKQLMDAEEAKRKDADKIMEKIMNGEVLDEATNKLTLRLGLNERTRYVDKIILFNSIKDKYSDAQNSYAFMQQMQRIGLIFLMTVVSISPTIPNVLCTAAIFIMEIKKMGYADKISVLCLITCFLILKDDLFMLATKLKWGGLFDLESQMNNQQELLPRIILNFHPKVIYFASAFLLLSNFSVLVIIGISKAVIIGINSLKMPASSIYWFFQIKKNAKQQRKSYKIVVDHKEWAAHETSFGLTLKNLVFVYPLELYVIVMVLIHIVVPKSAVSFMITFVLFPYLLSFVEFKQKETKAKLERLYFKFFNYASWLLLIIYYPVNVAMYSNKTNNIWSNFSPDFMLPLVILINKTYQDLLDMEDYTENQNKLKKNKALLSSLINLCYTYDYNEKKLKENLNIFMKQMHVIDCSEKTTGNETQQIQMDLIDDLFKYDNNMLDIVYQKASSFEKYKIKFFCLMYEFMLRLNYVEIFESVFYLYSTFKRKNKKAISESELNLNQFLKLESDMMLQSIKQVEQFYQKLRDKDTDKLRLFDEVLEKIASHIETMKNEEILNAEKNAQKHNQEEEEQSKMSYNKARPEIDHSQAADSIFQYLNQPVKMKKNDQDNFLFNLKKGEDLVFTNIQPYFIEKTDCFTKFDTMVVLKLFFGIFVSNLDMIIIVSMSLIHIWAGGVYAIIIFTIIFFILIEERAGRFDLWNMIAGIYFLILIFLIILNTSSSFVVATSTDNKSRSEYPNEIQAQLVLLILGKIDSLYGVCLLFFLIILLRINYEKLGFFNRDILSVENLPMAVHRIVINEEFYDIFDKEVGNEKLKIQTIEDKILHNPIEGEVNPITKTLTWNYILKLEKERIKVDAQTEKKRGIYIKSAYKVILMLRRDMFRIYSEVTDNFMWRNFSKYSFKPGKNYQPVIFMTLTIIILMFIVLYPSLLNTTKDFTEIFFENYVRTDFLVILIIYTLAISIEKYFSCLANPDVLTGNFWSQDRINKVLEKKGTNKKHLTPLERLQKCIWKVKLVIRLKRVRRGEGLVSPNRNPLMKKLYLTLLLWIFVCALVYFVFPIVGNRDTRVAGIKKVLCNDYYLEKEINFSTNKCHTLWKGNLVYCLFFFLNMLYVYYSALQIRYGFNQMRETIINFDWQSPMGYAYFKIYENMPLLREINTTIEFCAAHTSLTYLEWMKMEDIRGAMIQAKYQAERRLDKKVGESINGLVKICIGFSALIIVVLIIVSPLLLFSDLNPSHQVDPVQRGKMDVDLIFEKKGNFSLLSDLHMVASREGLGTKQRLEFSNIMETSMPFTPESIDNLADLLNKASSERTSGRSSSVFLRINLNIKTQSQDKLVFWTNYKSDSEVQDPNYNMNDKEGITTALSESLKKPCVSSGLVTQIFLGSIGSEFSVKDEKITFNDKNNKFPIILSIRCSEDNRKYISAAKNKNALIITESNHENATKLLKKIPRLNSASIIGLYVFIFITIGKGFIQPLLFGKAVHIWIRKSPNSLNVLLILEGMQAARANSNLFSEKALFYRLIDLIRSPKGLVNITGSMLETKKQELKMRLTREK